MSPGVKVSCPGALRTQRALLGGVAVPTTRPGFLPGRNETIGQAGSDGEQRDNADGVRLPGLPPRRPDA